MYIYLQVKLFLVCLKKCFWPYFLAHIHIHRPQAPQCEKPFYSLLSYFSQRETIISSDVARFSQPCVFHLKPTRTNVNITQTQKVFQSQCAFLASFDLNRCFYCKSFFLYLCLILAHENNFHCLAKAIDRIAVALCSNNGDNIEQRLREFLVVSCTCIYVVISLTFALF